MDKVLMVKRLSYTCIVRVGSTNELAGRGKPLIEFTIIRDGESKGYSFALDEWDKIVEFVKEKVTQHES